jgi:hypothetical protein
MVDQPALGEERERHECGGQQHGDEGVLERASCASGENSTVHG